MKQVLEVIFIHKPQNNKNQKFAYKSDAIKL